MNVKLTKRKAWELISRIQPRLNIKQEATPSDVAIFKASTGPEGLEIRCENDWFNHNGRIKLTIGNVDGGTPIKGGCGRKEKFPRCSNLAEKSCPSQLGFGSSTVVQYSPSIGRVYPCPTCLVHPF